MPFYVKKGTVPDKRHIQLRGEKGELRYEELFSRQGFSHIYSNGYHVHLPTKIKEVADFEKNEIKSSSDSRLKMHHWRTHSFEGSGNIVTGRKTIVYNNDVVLSSTTPAEDMSEFYRNAHADEMIFVHKGEGTLESMFGKLQFGPGDYIIIPRSILFRIKLIGKGHRFFIAETSGPIDTPKNFLNAFGQFLEDAPYSERDIRIPEFTEAVDQKGDFPLLIKTKTGFQRVIMDHHPFDLVGWDGYYYPYIFNIKDYSPVVGKVHLPPPVHLTFTAPGLVICSFVPRLFDFHEKAIPAPYNHSNVDSDEILYYVEGEFMSRKGIEEGSITLHPMGLPHGPQPGRIEASIGKKETLEYAVMVDTFAPLQIAKDSEQVEDKDYPFSWMAE